MHELDPEDQPGGARLISRRGLLAKAAVGGAVVWSAPILTTLATSASASSGTPSGCQCPSDPCNTVFCGSTGACVCGKAVEGDCFCYEPDICDNVIACSSTADCSQLGPGFRCVASCGCAAVGKANVCVSACLG